MTLTEQLVNTRVSAVVSIARDAAAAQRSATALEDGDVLLVTDAAFDADASERELFTPAIAGSSKNVSYDPAARRVDGSAASGRALDVLTAMLARFSDGARALVDELLPRYRGRIARRRASFRPVEIAGRATSWRKDDTRLHIDAFPASPVQGRRILRVFTNVNPAGRPRVWRIGGRFEAIAERFAPCLRAPMPGSASLLHWLHVTKSRRTPYDALMLQLHDRMKEDAAFQRDSPQTTVDFAPGSTWIAFTDQVAHAAMAGQYQLEQTFLLPVDAMEDQARAPLRILERLKGRVLA